MCPEKTIIPAYQPELFVNRTAEVGLVSGLVEQMLDTSAGPPAIRTIVFRGERGSGKTWLSLHLKRHILAQKPGVDTLLLNLFPPAEDIRAKEEPQAGELFIPDIGITSQSDPDKACKQILQWIAEQMQFEIMPNAPLANLGEYVVRGFKKRLEKNILVLIIDSVFEADWGFLEKLEQSFLGQLAALPRVLILMTGRGRLYPWISPYLRVDAKEKSLQAFTKREVEQQIEAQRPDSALSAEKVLELGGGYPFSNVMLASGLDNTLALNQVIEMLLSVAPRQQRAALRQHFEALCLLDGFRDEEIPYMLAAYFKDSKYINLTNPQVRELREPMVNTHLVHWEEGKFTIDEAIRKILDNYLAVQKDDPDRWRRLHCQAYALYLKWAKRFPKSQQYFEQKASRHANILETKGYVVTSCELVEEKTMLQ